MSSTGSSGPAASDRRHVLGLPEGVRGIREVREGTVPEAAREQAAPEAVREEAVREEAVPEEVVRERAARAVREEAAGAPIPVVRHPGWRDRFPWLAQGTTARGPERAPFDLALGGPGGGGPGGERWSALRRAEGMEAVVRSPQVHGAGVRLHRDTPPGEGLAPAGDGHVTDRAGVLVAVTVADCVPVFLAAERPRAAGVLHAGWRGTAAGVLEAGLDLLADDLGVDPGEVHVHLGPAICGSCYEVGPEVHEALGLEAPAGPAPVDLRVALARRALAAGVDDARVTVSLWCTRCGDPPFFSHRRGDAQRQAGFAGIRP